MRYWVEIRLYSKARRYVDSCLANEPRSAAGEVFLLWKVENGVYVGEELSAVEGVTWKGTH